MQVNLSEHTTSLAQQQAAATGFGDDIDAYVSHLIVVNAPASNGGAPSPRTKDELDRLLLEGIESGEAEDSWEEMMDRLRTEITAKMADNVS